MPAGSFTTASLLTIKNSNTTSVSTVKSILKRQFTSSVLGTEQINAIVYACPTYNSIISITCIEVVLGYCGSNTAPAPAFFGDVCKASYDLALSASIYGNVHETCGRWKPTFGSDQCGSSVQAMYAYGENSFQYGFSNNLKELVYPDSRFAPQA